AGLDRRGRDVASLPIWSPKRASGDVFRRHLYHTINVPIWRDSNDAPAKETAIPQIACGVDCRAVGQASREALQKRSLVRDRTRGQIVVIDPNSIGERVPEVEATLVRAPSQGIRDPDVSLPLRDFGVRIETKQNAILSARCAG